MVLLAHAYVEDDSILGSSSAVCRHFFAGHRAEILIVSPLLLAELLLWSQYEANAVRPIVTILFYALVEEPLVVYCAWSRTFTVTLTERTTSSCSQDDLTF